VFVVASLVLFLDFVKASATRVVEGATTEGATTETETEGATIATEGISCTAGTGITLGAWAGIGIECVEGVKIDGIMRGTCSTDGDATLSPADLRGTPLAKTSTFSSKYVHCTTLILSFNWIATTALLLNGRLFTQILFRDRFFNVNVVEVESTTPGEHVMLRCWRDIREWMDLSKHLTLWVALLPRPMVTTVVWSPLGRSWTTKGR
jgi:hypothetical protein